MQLLVGPALPCNLNTPINLSSCSSAKGWWERVEVRTPVQLPLASWGHYMELSPWPLPALGYFSFGFFFFPFLAS